MHLIIILLSFWISHNKQIAEEIFYAAQRKQKVKIRIKNIAVNGGIVFPLVNHPDLSESV